MHELPMVCALLEKLEKTAEENGFRKIEEVKISIGEMSSVVDECVEMYFESASAGTKAEGARLVFTHVPASLRCSSCGRIFPHDRKRGGDSFRCPYCGGDSTLVRGSGTDFVIDSVKGAV